MGLRGIPFSALYDSKTNQYLVQQYSVGLMPSFSLTNTDYKPLKNAQLLAMGASTFLNKQDVRLPYAKLGVEVITQIWNAQPPLLDEKFTPENLTLSRRNVPYGIVHLATHANFKADALKESSITFSNRKIGLHEVSDMQLHNPPTNLLVLVACETAIPDRSAELGFAGIAAKTGANSVIATLWSVEEQSSFSLMTSFYQHLKELPVKVQALQKAQIDLLTGAVQIDNKGVLVGINPPIPIPILQNQDGTLKSGETIPSFTHPHYWSGFTLIGNPW
jgi:CHAT domain-containing protein